PVEDEAVHPRHRLPRPRFGRLLLLFEADAQTAPPGRVADPRRRTLEPVEERDPAMGFADHLARREEKQQVPVLPEEPRQLGERSVQILHVLEDLVADDQVEGAVLEGNLAALDLPDRGPEQAAVPDYRQVLLAFIEGIGAGAVESQAARRLDHRPRTAAEVEDPRARAAGRGGLRPAEQVTVMDVEGGERRRQRLSQNVVEG